MRTFKDIYKTQEGKLVAIRSDEATPSNAKLYNGYDYNNQVWVMNGLYVRCGHLEAMQCSCYGREHAGEKVS